MASSFSLRYGTASPAALVARAAGLGMPALALTDRDGLYGAFKHAQACANAGIRPLFGADLALVDSLPVPPQNAKRVTLLAGGRRGWASLCRLVSAAHAAVRREDTPVVTSHMIAEHAEGLIVLLGPDSDVGQAVTARRPDLARQILEKWRNRTPDVVVEIVNHLDLGGTFRAARMAELAAETGTPAVLTNAVRYLDPADSRAAQVLDAARHLVPLGSPRLVPQNGRAYLASQADMVAVAERISVVKICRPQCRYPLCRSLGPGATLCACL